MKAEMLGGLLALAIACAHLSSLSQGFTENAPVVVKNLDPIAERFGISQPAEWGAFWPQAGLASAQGSDSLDSQQAVRVTQIRLAAILSGAPARAIFEPRSGAKHETIVLASGQSFGNLELIEVEARQVSIRIDGEQSVLRLYSKEWVSVEN